jgi:hypothetical protein
MSQSKEQRVFEMVKEGTHTRQEIIDEVGCTAGSFASYLAAFRNAAKLTGAAVCPVEIVDDESGNKVFTVKTWEEAEEIKAAQRASRPAAKAKTPEERLILARKRVDRTTTATVNARARFDKDPENRVLELRANRADIDAELAIIELTAAEAACRDAGIDPESVVEPEAEEISEASDDETLL